MCIFNISYDITVDMFGDIDCIMQCMPNTIPVSWCIGLIPVIKRLMDHVKCDLYIICVLLEINVLQ